MDTRMFAGSTRHVMTRLSVTPVVGRNGTTISAKERAASMLARGSGNGVRSTTVDDSLTTTRLNSDTDPFGAFSLDKRESEQWCVAVNTLHRIVAPKVAGSSPVGHPMICRINMKPGA